jgi:hypothetical protein
MNFTVGGWWAAFGLSFNSYNSTLDATGYDVLRLAYKGPGAGLTLSLGLGYADGTTTANDGYALANTASWTLIDIPLSYFTGKSHPINAINVINFNISGAATGAGHLYIDDIVLVKSATAVVPVAEARSVAAAPQTFTASMTGNKLLVSASSAGTVSVFSVSGALIARNHVGAAGSIKLPACAGTSIVRFSGENGVRASQVVSR